jgi:hypothetical protein
MLKAAAEDCPRCLRAQAEEELERLKDEAYRNEAMWTIPYRLLPLALTLPGVQNSGTDAERRQNDKTHLLHLKVVPRLYFGLRYAILQPPGT